MPTGTRTANLPATTLADSLLVNRLGSTRQQAIADFLAQIGASTSLAEALVPNARGLKGGLSNPYSDAKFDFFTGVLRQNPSVRTKWFWMNDIAHVPVGFDPDPDMLSSTGNPLYPNAAGGTLLAFYKRQTDARRIDDLSTAGWYNRVGAIAVVPDEILARDWGVSVGAKVTRTGIKIHGSMHKTRHGRIYWTGSAWDADSDGLHPTGVVSTSWDATNGILTVDHEWLPGYALTLVPDCRAGLVSTPFMPVFYEVNANGTQFKLRFAADGAGPGFGLRTGSPGSGMSFRWTKTYDGPLMFDGSLGFENLPWADGENGNLFVIGANERP